MVNISAETSYSNLVYTITDTSTNKGDATGKRVKLTAQDGTDLYDSGPGIDVSINSFPVPVTTDWITHLAILQAQVYISYNELGGTVTGPLQQNYLLPTISNIKQS